MNYNVYEDSRVAIQLMNLYDELEKAKEERDNYSKTYNTNLWLYWCNRVTDISQTIDLLEKDLYIPLAV